MERSYVGTWDFPVNYYSLWNGRRTMTEEVTSLSTPSLLNVLRFDKIRENGKLRLPPAGARFRIIWRGKDWRSKISGNLPPLCSSVLKPRFHLGVGHLQGFSQRCPFGRCQILLFVKTFLQFGDLQPGEARPRLLSLRWRPVLIRMPDPPWKRSGYCRRKKKNPTIYNSIRKFDYTLA